MEQGGDVEELGVERLAIERGERHAEDPGAMTVRGDGGRLLPARRLGLAGRRAVGRPEVLEGDVTRAGREAAESELHAPRDDLGLRAGDRADEAPPLGAGQRPVRPAGPLEAAQAGGIGMVGHGSNSRGSLVMTPVTPSASNSAMRVATSTVQT